MNSRGRTQRRPSGRLVIHETIFTIQVTLVEEGSLRRDGLT
jgi:hypothetical protein